jgi:hypothetical protein
VAAVAAFTLVNVTPGTPQRGVAAALDGPGHRLRRTANDLHQAAGPPKPAQNLSTIIRKLLALIFFVRKTPPTLVSHVAVFSSVARGSRNADGDGATRRGRLVVFQSMITMPAEVQQAAEQTQHIEGERGLDRLDEGVGQRVR